MKPEEELEFWKSRNFENVAHRNDAIISKHYWQDYCKYWQKKYSDLKFEYNFFKFICSVQFIILIYLWAKYGSQ